MNIVVITVVLFFTPCVYAEEQDSDILTFGLNIGADALSSDIWMRTTFEFPNGTEEITMCLNVKIMYIDGEASVLMHLMTKPKIFLAVTGDNKIILSNTAESFSTELEIIPRKWMHICVTINETNVSIFIDDKPVIVDSSWKVQKNVFKGSVQMVLGAPNGFASLSNINSIIGYLTLPQVFPRVLEDEIKDLAMGGEVLGNLLQESEWNVYCQSNLEFATVSSNNSHVSVIPSNYTCDNWFDVQWEDSSEVFLPRSLYDYVFLNKILTYSEAEQLCSNLGGDIPSLEDMELFAKMENVRLNPQYITIISVSKRNANSRV